ncbi:MAG: hypothetical protein AAFZ09_12640, partial [Pseudomonadota bacterium]
MASAMITGGLVGWNARGGIAPPAAADGAGIAALDNTLRRLEAKVVARVEARAEARAEARDDAVAEKRAVEMALREDGGVEGAIALKTGGDAIQLLSPVTLIALREAWDGAATVIVADHVANMMVGERLYFDAEGRHCALALAEAGRESARLH